MIAHIQTRESKPDRASSFVELLPQIRAVAEFAFRRLSSEERTEAIQEVTASSFVAFTKLVHKKRAYRAFGSTLGRFAVRQYWSGRRTGTRINSRDALSFHRRRYSVPALRELREDNDRWTAVLVAGSRTPVADQAAFRIDFAVWLGQLRTRHREVVNSLIMGSTTSDVARQHRITAARVSQLRRELQDSWERFHGDEVQAGELASQG